MARKEMGIVPDSDLARLLDKLDRPDRRLLLAAIQASPGPRRKRMTKEVERRLRNLGLA